MKRFSKLFVFIVSISVFTFYCSGCGIRHLSGTWRNSEMPSQHYIILTENGTYEYTNDFIFGRRELIMKGKYEMFVLEGEQFIKLLYTEDQIDDIKEAWGAAFIEGGYYVIYDSKSDRIHDNMDELIRVDK